MAIIAQFWMIPCQLYVNYTDTTLSFCPEDNYHKDARVDDIPCVMDILDTAGQDEYSQMQDQVG